MPASSYLTLQGGSEIGQHRPIFLVRMVNFTSKVQRHQNKISNKLIHQGSKYTQKTYIRGSKMVGSILPLFFIFSIQLPFWGNLMTCKSDMTSFLGKWWSLHVDAEVASENIAYGLCETILFFSNASLVGEKLSKTWQVSKSWHSPSTCLGAIFGHVWYYKFATSYK